MTMPGLGVMDGGPELMLGESVVFPLRLTVAGTLTSLVLAPSDATVFPVEPAIDDTTLPVPNDRPKSCGMGHGGSEPLVELLTGIGRFVAGDDEVRGTSEPVAGFVGTNVGDAASSGLPASLVEPERDEESPAPIAVI